MDAGEGISGALEGAGEYVEPGEPAIPPGARTFRCRWISAYACGDKYCCCFKKSRSFLIDARTWFTSAVSRSAMIILSDNRDERRRKKRGVALLLFQNYMPEKPLAENKK